jgi:membrane-associated phospholipid phosphatase
MSWRKDFFLFGQVGILIILLLLQLSYSQLSISLWINKYHTPFLDFICLYGTYFGDGLFIILLCLALFFYKPKVALFLLFSYLLSSGLTQALKNFVFHDHNRPLFFLRELPPNSYYYIPGAEWVLKNSFPSGHTTSAFSLFAGIGLLIENKSLKFFFLGLAIFTAFTRIYLLQHFLIDTCMGSLIGTSITYLIYYFLYQTGRLNFLFNRFTK